MAAASGLQAIGTAAFLEDLIVNGIIGGLGAVLGFLPQMAILFVLLSILEDCGYMVRVAFVMDRIFRKFGLSGKSFIPLLISSGCGIPGIMASKTIENDTVSKTWHHHGEHCAQLADYLPQWQAAGARLIGGCCRTTPADIAALKARS